MNKENNELLIKNYQRLFSIHGCGPEAVQISYEGQQFRFEKLSQIADLKGKRVLDLGCGLGDFFPFLKSRFNFVSYTGIDIVPETIEYAIKKYPDARFLCCDILTEDIYEIFDYVMISGVFNNAVPKSTEIMKEIIKKAFNYCSLGLGFNFISTYVNFTDPEMAYHDPVEIFDFCLRELTTKVKIEHHYERCDVVIFSYK